MLAAGRGDRRRTVRNKECRVCRLRAKCEDQRQNSHIRFCCGVSCDSIKGCLLLRAASKNLNVYQRLLYGYQNKLLMNASRHWH